MNSKTMKAFHGDVAIKAKYIGRVLAHAEADQIIHGKYWENGKGCAVGCTIHGSDHMAYEREGIAPVMLARLEDSLFEGMTNGRAKQFPLQFLSAIKVGADLSLVGWKFLHWLLTEGLDHALRKNLDPLRCDLGGRSIVANGKLALELRCEGRRGVGRDRLLRTIRLGTDLRDSFAIKRALRGRVFARQARHENRQKDDQE